MDVELDAEYAEHGVRFVYPQNWELTEQRDGVEISISLSSPQTSFWILTLFLDRPDPRRVIEAALDAFRQEYTELDVYSVKARLCGKSTVARDIEFVCLELLNSAWLRALRTRDFTLLILYQAHDAELDINGPILKRITKSLALEEQQEFEDEDEVEQDEENEER